LTFAYRQALYALDQLSPQPGALQHALEQEMLADPSHWQAHYHGDEASLYHQRHFGLADRIRYYWPLPAAQDAVKTLRDGFTSAISDRDLQKAFPAEVLERHAQLGGTQVQSLIDAQIQLALDPYFFEEAP
jgi:D-tagatose-1,6-bisphosphate aldolase subunit GatZ/KbaZ